MWPDCPKVWVGSVVLVVLWCYCCVIVLLCYCGVSLVLISKINTSITYTCHLLVMLVLE